MAIVNNGTRVSCPSTQIPSGYTLPTVTSVSGPELFVNRTTFTVLKSTIENATATTAFSNLVSEVNTAANNMVTDFFQAAEDITHYTVITNIEDNTNVDEDESAYTTAAEQFTVSATMYVQVVDVT